MYLLVLSLAIAVLAIGLVTLGFGIPVNEFDTMIVAGTIAAVAGLVLLALAAILRELRRIADALTAQARPGATATISRPESRPAAPAVEAPVEIPARPRPELVTPARAPEQVIAEPEAAPLSPRPALWPARRPAERTTPRSESASRSEPEPAPEPRVNGGAPAQRPFTRSEPRSAAPLRVDQARAEAPARAEPAPRPEPTVRAEPPVRAEPALRAPPPPRTEPSVRAEPPKRPEPLARPEPPVRPDPGGRAEPEPPAWMTTNRQASASEPAAGPTAPERRRSLFDSVWPRSRKATDAAPPEEAAPVQEPAWDVPDAHAAHAPEPAYEEAPVEILKSGVIDGMAYTLYTDGSIEAQLAQGTVRFASIEALRIHLEQEG